MSKIVNVNVGEDFTTVAFDVASVMPLGDKMNAVCEEAYMNGYSWDAFINYYLEKNAPDVLDVIESDPEAEMYCVYVEDEDTAKKLEDILEDILANEETVLDFLEENKDDIEWD